MKNTVHELITDLKAAVLIGDLDSIHAAVDQIRGTGDSDLPPSALLPLGEILARLEPADFLQFLDDDDAAVRGAAAAASALAWIAGKKIEAAALDYAADDPAPEVRAAFTQALARAPEKAAAFAEAWLTAEPETTRQSGIQLLGQLVQPSLHLIKKLEPFDGAEDQETRTVLVETVNTLGAHGMAGPVLDLLSGWARRTEPNVWVITRALSASWSLGESVQALEILQKLADRVGEIRPVVRAMERHRP